MSAPASTPDPAEAPRRAVLTREVYERFSPSVRRIAMRVARQVPASISVSDLVGSGFVGLVDALGRVAPGASGDEVTAFIEYRVRAAMLDYVRTFDRRAGEAEAASRRLTQAIAKSARALGRAPTEDEIAAELGLSRPEYRNLLSAIGAAGAVRLDAVPPEIEDGTAEAVAAMVEKLSEALRALPEIAQQVLALHHQEGCTFAEIALVLEIEERRAAQIYTEATHRLRAGLTREDGP